MYLISLKNVTSTRRELVACFLQHGGEEVSVSTDIGYLGEILDIIVFHVAI